MSTTSLKVNTSKTQTMRKNTRVWDSNTVKGTPLEEVRQFVYLGSKVTVYADCRNSKSNQAIATLKPFWRSDNFSVHTKIKISGTISSMSFCMDQNAGRKHLPSSKGSL